MGMSAAGYAGLAAGEDWHYVGAAGEPAFENGWSNEGSADLAFRYREPGIVDISGVVKNTAASFDVIFTLPEGYRPTSGAFPTASGQTAALTNCVAVVVSVGSDGGVAATRGLGGTGAVQFVYFATQVQITAS